MAQLKTTEPQIRPVPADEPAARQAAPTPPPPAAERPAAPAERRPPVKRVIVALVLLVALGFGARTGWHWWTVGRYMVSTDDAYVQAEITVLAAKVSGYLTDVRVDNNQRVKAGDVIARIDDGDYRLAMESARDKVATQRSTVARIGRQEEAAKAAVAQAEAQIASARAEQVRTAADFERQQRLAQADFASRAKFDEARAARDQSAAAVRSAEAALLQAQANVEVTAAQRVEAERLVTELETQVRKAERDIAFTEIRAPFDGVIGNKAVETGSYVQTGQRLAALVPLSSVRIDANFKETQLARMRPGQPVHVSIDAFPEHDFTGRVVSMAPASGSVFSLLPADNATGNFTKIVQRVPVRIEIPADIAARGLLRPGLSVEVSVDTRGDAAAATHSTAAAEPAGPAG